MHAECTLGNKKIYIFSIIAWHRVVTGSSKSILLEDKYPSILPSFPRIFVCQHQKGLSHFVNKSHLILWIAIKTLKKTNVDLSSTRYKYQCIFSRNACHFNFNSIQNSKKVYCHKSHQHQHQPTDVFRIIFQCKQLFSPGQPYFLHPPDAIRIKLQTGGIQHT